MLDLTLCALQLGTLPLSDSRIDYYLKLAKDNGAKIVLLGEYVLNTFFTELIKMPGSMIKEQSEQKRTALQAMAAKYELIIIAPIILVRGKDYIKAIARFSPNSVKYKLANALMPYSHWNENSFFKTAKNIDISSFSVDGFKFANIFGFEAHFDVFWREIAAKRVDCVLIPSACTLDSNLRWANMLSSQAFRYNAYILRANRLGKAKFKEGQKEVISEFYGDSMLINPNGQISQKLDEKEGMLICKISKSEIAQARRIWCFSQIARNLESYKENA